MFCPKCRAENPNIAKFCKDCGKQLPDFAQVVARTQQYHQAQAGLVGQVIDGKYRIDAKLGSGGMGDVYRATRLLMGDVVAIKTLHSHLAQDNQAAERFRREAITATKLRHKNVVTIYDVGISAAHRFPYILMELAEGYTLRQIINENKSLPLDFVVTVIAQVCAAMTEAHQLGIIHRDIKPENIIADQTNTGWHIKVLDFGIAKLYNQPDADLTQDGSALGTPQYMSPEQCLGEHLDVRSDIYSIGITLYELLCGKTPFSSYPPMAISVHQVGTPPTPPSQLNPNLIPEIEKVVLKALSKQREERQQSAQQLSQEFIQAATVAFKAGVNPNEIEEPIAEPISKEFNLEAVDEPKVDETAKEETVLEMENISEEIEEKESEDLENEKIEDSGDEIAEDVLDTEISENLSENNSTEIKSESDEIESSEEIEDNMSEIEIKDDEPIKSFEDVDIKEDLSDLFEEAEHILDELLVDSRKAKAVSNESQTVNDEDSLEPIPMPNASITEINNAETEISGSDTKQENPPNQNINFIEKSHSQISAIQMPDLFAASEIKSNNKNILIIAGIGVLGFLILIILIGIGAWLYQ